jgi:hypothetical protein
MQWVKIQIPERADCARGFVEMARRGTVHCFRDNVFIVPEPALLLLYDLGVSYLELGRGGFDYALEALRDAQATSTQTPGHA